MENEVPHDTDSKPLSAVTLAKSLFEKSLLDKNGKLEFNAKGMRQTVGLVGRVLEVKDKFVMATKEKFEQKSGRCVPATIQKLVTRAASLDSSTSSAATCYRLLQQHSTLVSSKIDQAHANSENREQVEIASLPSVQSYNPKPIEAEVTCVDELLNDGRYYDDYLTIFRDLLEQVKSFSNAVAGNSSNDLADETLLLTFDPIRGIDDVANADTPYCRLLSALRCCKSHIPLLHHVAKTLVRVLIALGSYRKHCSDLELCNKKNNQDLQNLQLEMAETKDKFSEDTVSESSSLQRELKELVKSNRVMQFKLKSAEKRVQEMEIIKVKLDDELKRSRLNTSNGCDRSPVSKDLKSELLALRDAAATAKAEYSNFEGAKQYFELEMDKLKRERTNLQMENQKLRFKTADNLLQNSNGDTECERLLRTDLETSIEREKDAKEQLQFAVDEAASLRRKLKEFENDNDSLVHRIKCMAAAKAAPVHGNGDSMPPRRASFAADALTSRNETRTSGSSAPSPISKMPSLCLDEARVYREAKYEVLNQELEDLKWQLAERDAIIAQAKERSKKKPPQLRKAVSLDSSDINVDSSRQINLMHQEAQVLKDKLQHMEADYEKLMKENKKLLMLMSRKVGSSDRKLPGEKEDGMMTLKNENIAMRQKLEMVLSITQSGKLINELESENSTLRTELAYYRQCKRQVQEEDD